MRAVEMEAEANRRAARFLHVVQVRSQDDKGPGSRCQLERADGRQILTVTTAVQTLRLSLPGRRDIAGTIAIATADGKPAIEERLLPSGVMPHGEEGMKLMQRWDTPYHDGRRPGWDTGRVAVVRDPRSLGRGSLFACDAL